MEGISNCLNEIEQKNKEYDNEINTNIKNEINTLLQKISNDFPGEHNIL
jgi:hypothetical protein